jgi:signal transduction histidine kinase
MNKLFFCILYFISFSVTAQHNDSLNDNQWVIDSLKHKLAVTKSDSIKCILYFKLSDNYLKINNINEFKSCKKKANSLVKNNSFLKDLSYFYNADEYYIKSDFDGYQKALISANVKLQKYKIGEIYSLRARAIRNQCIVYQIMGNEKESFRILIDEALPLARKGTDKEVLAIINYTLGIICFNNENYAKAAYYYNKAIISFGEKLVFQKHVLVDSYLQYAHVQVKLGNPKPALIAIEKAKKILQKHPDSNLNATYYLERAYYEHFVKNYLSAISNFDKAMVIALKSNDSSNVMRINLLKSNSLIALKRFHDAKSIFLAAISDKNMLVSDKREVLKELALTYKALNDYENAINFYERYIHLSDSLDENENHKIITNLEAKYNHSENKNKIKELETEKQQALLTAKYNQLHYIVFGLISFILLLTCIFLFKNSKNQRKIVLQKEINYQQNINAFKTQKELEVMQAMIVGEEAERKRIARDLHDGIGSRLSALKMQLQGFVPLEADNIANFSNSLSLSIIELRQIAFNLMPETLLKLGLEMALKDLCNNLRTNKVTIAFHANGISKTISASDQVNIFRIVQELINNALKHSYCTEIIVDCSQNQKLFLITVEDNGNGFDVSLIDSFQGFGLKNIKNRIHLLKGKLEINAKHNRGSIFNIALTLNNF